MTIATSRRGLLRSAGLVSLPWFIRPALSAPRALERYVAIDDVCAWPKLAAMPDGTIAAAIHNRPIHGGKDAEVECWVSRDQGRHWSKAGVPAPRDATSSRYNHAIGALPDGSLYVAASGWSSKATEGPNTGLKHKGSLMQSTVSRSRDGGRTWQVLGVIPQYIDGYHWIPFGNIEAGADGSLNMAAYIFRPSLNPRRDTCAILRSTDGGKAWRVQGLIGDSVHNETDLMHAGGGRWLAAARAIEGVYNGVKRPALMDVLESDDDGKTWRLSGFTTQPGEFPGDLCRLKDGRIALTYGSRREDFFGVVGRISTDNGKTWSAPLKIADSFEKDCGYPSSAALPDGKVLTAYYSRGAAQHRRYHMGVVIWDPA